MEKSLNRYRQILFEVWKELHTNGVCKDECSKAKAMDAKVEERLDSNKEFSKKKYLVESLCNNICSRKMHFECFKVAIVNICRIVTSKMSQIQRKISKTFLNSSRCLVFSIAATYFNKEWHLWRCTCFENTIQTTVAQKLLT